MRYSEYNFNSGKLRLCLNYIMKDDQVNNSNYLTTIKFKFELLESLRFFLLRPARLLSFRGNLFPFSPLKAYGLNF